MALVNANGIGVVQADFTLPLSRAWHADLTIATSDPTQIDGAVTISINDGALTMKGTAKVEDVYLDTVRARVVAGAGGLGKTAAPKFYQQPTVRIVLADLLAVAGETLSSTADAGVLGTQLAAWTVTQMTVADAIGLLLAHVGASWRMLADGTLWAGSETWPDSGLSYSLELEDKAHAQVAVTLEAPLLLPGTQLGGRKVSYVETHVDAKSVRSIAWVGTGDRLRDPMVAMTRSALAQVDYFGLYRCKVVAQSSDLTTLDLIPDDPRLPSTGFRGILLRHGLPGCKVQVSAGTYVRLGWDGGDQSKPYCALWDGGESPTKVQIAGTHPLPLWDTFLADLANLIADMAGASAIVVGGTGIPTTPFSTHASTMATKIAAGSYNSQIVSNG